MRRLVGALVMLALLVAAGHARADRTQVYSIRGADCGDCGNQVLAALKKLKGVKRATFDRYSVEVTATVTDAISDAQVTDWIQKSSPAFTVIVGADKGAYLPLPEYPKNADVQILTRDGSALGDLAKLRVAGKYTVFDVYADWCGPCRVLDHDLRDLVATRSDIAVRKLNVVRFESPLAREFGASLKVLPHVVVFTPTGVRHDLSGADSKRVAAALRAK